MNPMLKNLLSELKRSAFLKGTFSIAGGTALGQLLLVASSPILTRLYDPTAMGMFGLFVSFVSLASTAGTLRYEVAIVATPDEKDSVALTKGSLIIAVFMAIFFGIIFDLLRRNALFGFQVFPRWAFLLIILGILGVVWGFTLRFYAIRQMAFGIIGRFTLGQAMFRVLFPIFLSPLGKVGLFIGEVLGRLAGLTVLRKIFPEPRGPWLHLPVLFKYKKYPLVLLPSAMLNTLALMGIVPVFSQVFGVTTAGHLTLAQRVLGLPVSLIGSAVSDVFYGKAAEIIRSDVKRLPRFFMKTFLGLGTLAILLGIGVWYLAPSVSRFIFGSEWHQAGLFMKIRAPLLVAQLSISPLGRFIFLTPYPWLKLIYDVGSLIVISLPLWIPFKDSSKALWTISISQVVLYLLYFGLMLILLRIMQKYSFKLLTVN